MRRKKITRIIVVLVLFTMMLISTKKVNAAEELPDDGARISSAQIIQTKTGTGPFDDNDEPGNDSSEDNNIVRSFDQVTWTVENTIALNGDSSASYTGGRIYFEATLPDVFTSETAKWDLDSMKWVENVKESSDGLTITGYYKLSNDNITVPGKQTLVFVAKILGAANGIEFQPTITTWLNGNDKGEHKTIIPDKIRISAAPKYNVRIANNGNLSNKVTLNYGEGDVTGRMYGYGILLQLYNDNPSKGLKGIEYPKNEISFDVDMKFERTIFGSKEREDITSECTPILWNYKVNDLNRYGEISDRTMYFGNTYNVYHNGLPLGIKHKERRYSVCNSGKYKVEQSGSKLSFKIDNYAFDEEYPIWNYGYGALGTSIVYQKNIGCFSVGYFEVFIPDNSASTVQNRNYYLTMNENNFKATSISGIEANSEMVTRDDISTIQHVLYKPGTYSHNITLYKYNSSILGTLASNRGDGYATLGQKLEVMAKFVIDITNDFDILSASKFIKFDGDAFEPFYYDNGNEYRVSSFAGDMKFNLFYITKRDGSNWSSYEEMRDANIEDDMNFYDRIEDIPENEICIGVFAESTTGTLVRTTGDNNCFFFPIKVKDTAVIGQTYGFVERTKLWKEYLDREEYTITNPNKVFPNTTWDSGNQKYIKTEYDQKGNIISGTHSGGSMYGNSLLIVGGELSVQKTAIDDNAKEKVNYDISKNEYDVKYKITPILKNIQGVNSNIKGITIKVVDTIPSNITYVPGSSNYGNPEITTNSDGSTNLTWYIYDCELGKEINPVIYEAHIDENVTNGETIESKVYVEGDTDKIGITDINYRTANHTIQVINLSSHRLYKIDTTPVIEKDGEIHYTLSYKNNTDEKISDFQLLDILPYNGDGRGTDYTGTYKLDRIVISQEDSNGNVRDNSNLKLLYTNDEGVRTTATSKDENLGEGWTEATIQNIKAQATAVVLKGEVGEQGKVTIDVYLKTTGNKGLNKYVNSATAQVYKATEEMTTSNVVSQVVERKIEGIVWEDKNANGIKDEDEVLLKNVEIILTDDQGNQVTDVNGEKVGSKRTDINGYYKFEDLPKGIYYVKVAVIDNSYQLTDKEVGTNLEVNSKFNVEEKETDKITRLNSIDLPELTVSHVNAGMVKKPTKVVVNYKEVGTQKGLFDEIIIDGRIDEKYKTEDKINDINQKYENKYQYVSVDGNIEGEMVEDTLYVTYWYEKKQGELEVNYLEVGTEKVLATKETSSKKVDEEYITENKLDEINLANENKYEFVNTTGAPTNGVYKLEKQVVNYYYQKKLGEIEVNYLEVGTEKVLATKEISSKKVDEDYITENKLDEINEANENKYEFVNTTGAPTNGVYKLEKQIINYYYQKKPTKVKVLHVLEGTDVSSPEAVSDVLYNTEEITGRVDEEYETQDRVKEINEKNKVQYELVEKEVENKTGNMKVDTIYVIYEYRTIPAKVKVNHLEKDTNDVLYTQEVLNGYVGIDYSTENKLSQINIKNSNKYELVTPEPENKNGVYTRDEQEVTYYYEKKQGEIEVNYLEIGTEKVLATKEISSKKVDEEYVTENKLDEINEANENKYEFVNTTGAPTVGVYKLEKQIINYYYQKKPTKVKVLHVLEGIDVSNPETVTDVLYRTEEITGRVDEEYTTSSRLNEINENSKIKYELVSVTNNANGNMTLDTQYVIYVYQKVPAKITVKYMDMESKKELLESEIKENYVGEDYTTEDKLEEINKKYEDKYELVREPENKNGTYTKDEQEIIYYYQKRETNVVVKYIDIETEEELLEEVKIVGRIDDIYETVDRIEEINDKNTNKYILVKTTENTKGNMELETIEVIYYYKKVEAQVIVKYLDFKTGEEISDRDYLGGYVGDKYKTEAKEIDEYELVIKEMPKNKEGIYEEETIEVIYYYNKIEKPVQTGDIDIIAIVAITIICTLGIIFVVKNKDKVDE